LQRYQEQHGEFTDEEMAEATARIFGGTASRGPADAS
jgi:hypothetical protein